MNEKFNKIFLLLYSLLFAITPFVMFHKTSELFEFNKMLFIYLVTSAIFCVWLFRSLLYRKPIISMSFLSIPLLIFLGSQLLSTITSIDHETSLFGYYGRFNGGLLPTLTYIVLYFAFISNIDTKKVFPVLEKLLTISIIGSAIVLLWGLPSKFGFDLTCFAFTGHLNVDCWTEQFKPTIRIFSTLGQPNWLGAYLATHFFIGAYFFLRKEQARKTLILYGAYLLLNFSGILLTTSRSALLSLPIGIVLIASYFIINKSKYILNRKKEIGILIALFLCSIVVFKTGIGSIDRVLRLDFKPSVSNQSAQISSETKPVISQNVSNSFTIRKIVWQGGYSLGLQHILLGTGPETFAYAYNFTRPREHNLTSEWDYVYNKAHNEFVNYFATSGIAGILSYLLLIGCTIVLFLRVIKSDVFSSAQKLLAATLLSGYLSILITNFFGFSTTTVNIYFYLLPAFAAILMVKREPVKDISTALTNQQKIFSVLSVCIFLVLGVFVLRYFLADTHYAMGENYRNIDDYDEALRQYYQADAYKHEHVYEEKIAQTLAQKGFIEGFGTKKMPLCFDSNGKKMLCGKLSEDYMKKALKGSPLNVYYWKTKSRNEFLIYQTTGDEIFFDQAIMSMRKARELAPTDPRLPYTQGLYYLAKYEPKKSLTLEEKRLFQVNGLGPVEFAISLKPNYKDALYLKALILKQLGQKDEAKKLLESILKDFGEDSKIKEELKAL